MKKGDNFNHPKKNATIKVDPIKNVKDIQSIKKLLKDNPRDYCLFVLGINTNLRAIDLLKITAGQVRHLKPMDELVLREQKTGKERRITLNKACIEAIQGLLASKPYQDDEPLFLGRKGNGEAVGRNSSSVGSALRVPSVNRLVKQWCEAVNLRGNYGAHTLRKTWGYHQRVTFGQSLPELMVCFNHSTQKQTLDYLCIQPEEIKSIYANEL